MDPERMGTRARGIQHGIPSLRQRLLRIGRRYGGPANHTRDRSICCLSRPERDREIYRYTGPLNFKGVKEDLERKGLADKADDYLMATGKLAALLYKEEIERAMKTPGISGFQLLDLHDFPDREQLSSAC